LLGETVNNVFTHNSHYRSPRKISVISYGKSKFMQENHLLEDRQELSANQRQRSALDAQGGQSDLHLGEDKKQQGYGRVPYS